LRKDIRGEPFDTVKIVFHELASLAVDCFWF